MGSCGFQESVLVEFSGKLQLLHRLAQNANPTILVRTLTTRTEMGWFEPFGNPDMDTLCLIFTLTLQNAQ